MLLVLLIAGSGLGVLSANAVTAYEILDKLAILDSNGAQGTYGNLKPGSSYTNGQCWQYVKDISTYVFGQTMYIPNTASYLSGADDNYYNVRQPVKNCGYDAIVNLLKLAQPGDLICLRNSKVDQTYGHIMFVGSVTTSRITVYQAASGYARKDTVDLTVSGLQSLYSFGYSGQASFYGSNYGVALFRSIKRTGQSDYSYELTEVKNVYGLKSTYHVGETISLSWDAVPGATSYIMRVYYPSDDGRFPTYGSDEVGNKTYGSVLLNEAGTFYVQIIVISSLGVNRGQQYYFSVVPNDTTAPIISDVVISDITTTGYTVTCTVTDESGLNRVQFPSWHTWDDLKWLNGSINGSSVSCRINISDFANATGYYTTHIYAYDIWGNSSSANAGTVYVPSESERYTVTYNANGGTGAPSPHSDYVSIQLSNTKPTRTYYSFLGWAESASAASAQYQPGETISPGKSLTLYAVWQKNEVTLQSISVRTNPTQTTYTVGDTLNTAGLNLTAAYSDGSTQTVTSGFTCTPTKLNTAGQQIITVTYNGKTTTFDVTVNPAPATLTGISVKTNPTQMIYTVGDTLNTAGLTLTAAYSYGSTQTVTSGFTCSPTKLNTAGQQTITVTCGGQTTSFVVTVNNAAPSQGKAKAVSLNNTIVNYKAKTTLKPTVTADEGVTYTVSYSSSNPNVVKVNEKTGEVTGAKKGSASITCTVTDEFGNTVSDTCKVTVNYTVWQWVIKILLFGWIWY